MVSFWKAPLPRAFPAFEVPCHASLELSAEHRHASDVQDSNGSDKGNVIIWLKRGSIAVLLACVALSLPLYTVLLTTSALLSSRLCAHPQFNAASSSEPGQY
jgi:hypothetical protein